MVIFAGALLRPAEGTLVNMRNSLLCVHIDFGRVERETLQIKEHHIVH